MNYSSLFSQFCTLAFATLFSCAVFADGGGFSTSSVHFNMDACSSFVTQGTHSDYSEFTGAVDNSASCLQMSVLGNLYRLDPSVNPHSCTPGISGAAMCVSSFIGCNYDAGNMRSVNIDIRVTPGTDGTGSLGGLSFYEQAPETYVWTNGPSGTNNYPTLYGVRILRNGTEIWRSEGNATSTTWSLESFSFLGNDDFTVTETTDFRIEFLGYCVVGNGSDVTAWDLDEIMITSSCGDPLSGGNVTLVGGAMNTSTCVGLGVSSPIDVVLTNNVGPNSSFIITDETGNILALPSSPPFDFEGAGPGICFIYHTSFTGALGGLAVGENIDNLTGCFELSNSVRVDRFTASGGTLTADGATDVCASGSNLVSVSVNGAVGSTRLLVTDLNGNIIGLPTGSPVDLSQFNVNSCLIWNVGYNGNIGGLAIGNNASDITGLCFNLSNSIAVSKTVVDSGVISTNGVTFVNICEGNGSSNVVDVTVNGAQGSTQLVIADANGVIIDANPTFPFDFAGLPTATYFVYNVSYSGMITGVTNGSNVNDISGFCTGLSNSIEIAKESAEGGTISSPMGSDFEICIEGVVSDPIPVNSSGSNGRFGRWIITDDAGNITGLPGNPPFVLDPLTGDVCNIWFLAFEPSFQGLFLGQNVSAFTGCFDLSNNVRITKRSVSAGRIGANGGFTFIDVCGSGGDQTVNVDLINNFGPNQTFVLSRPDGTIIGLQTNPAFDFTSFALGEYRINHVAYFEGSGPVIGGNINSISADCLDISNEMVINKFDPAGGTISSPEGDNIDVCSDGLPDNIEVSINGNRGGFNQYIITDPNGNIIGLPGVPPFNVEGFPEGTCFLWNIAFENGINGIQIGTNVNAITGCFSLSNSIQINKRSIAAGNITLTDGSTETGVCLQDNLPDVVDFVSSGSTGMNGAYVVTDDAGNILVPDAGSSFDFAPAGPGVCRVYFVSYDDAITGLMAGNRIFDIGGCFALSNFVTINRDISGGGTVVLDNGSTETSICVGEGSDDLINVNLGGTVSGNTNRWIITDDAGNILALPSAPPFNLEGAGVGICNIYNVNFSGNITGLTTGGNISALEGCYGLSNAVVVNRLVIDNSSSVSTLTYTMNACNAQSASTGGADYSELTSIANNSSSCTTLSGSNLYRRNPTQNPHSCTPGPNGSPAVCISSQQSCSYSPNSDLALRFDVTIDPAANGMGTLSNLSFLEAAPEQFTWINGTSGPNNFPTLYGLRVLKNGTEIYRQAGIPTSNDYSLESFDFSGNGEFTVTQSTVFSFELLGYCTAGISSTITAWDLEDITVTSECLGGLNGGNLTISGGGTVGSTSVDVCVDDGQAENIMVNLVNAAGPNMQYVITDSDLTILALPQAQPFNFEGIFPGTCLVWNLAFVDGIVGAEVGLNAGDLSGCFSLSNPITVNRLVGDDCVEPLLGGGQLTLSNGLVADEFCVTDGEADMLDVVLTNAEGTNSTFIITNEDDMILEVGSNFPYDLEGTQAGIILVYNLSYNGTLANMSIGSSIQNITGEYAISNSLRISKTDCTEVTFAERPGYDRVASDFVLYPNPANNSITVSSDGVSAQTSTVEIFNAYGQLVDTRTITNENVSIDLSTVPSGHYYMRIKVGNTTYDKSFIKM